MVHSFYLYSFFGTERYTYSIKSLLENSSNFSSFIDISFQLNWKLTILPRNGELVSNSSNSFCPSVEIMRSTVLASSDAAVYLEYNWIIYSFICIVLTYYIHKYHIMIFRQYCIYLSSTTAFKTGFISVILSMQARTISSDFTYNMY